MVQEGTPNDLYAKPANSFVAEFIGRTNVLRASLVQDKPEKKMVRLAITDFGTEMTSQYDGELPKDIAYVTIRYNEIGLSSTKPDTDENVVKGEILSREYRGSVTDHKIQVGESQIIVTTHRFCNSSESPSASGAIYLRVSPHAIRPLATSD